MDVLHPRNLCWWDLQLRYEKNVFRWTTVYHEGSARNYVPAINSYEGNGALWFRRRVLIEPRFEVHLKAALQKAEVIESENDQIFDGFTIVISG